MSKIATDEHQELFPLKDCNSKIKKKDKMHFKKASNLDLPADIASRAENKFFRFPENEMPTESIQKKIAILSDENKRIFSRETSKSLSVSSKPQVQLRHRSRTLHERKDLVTWSNKIITAFAISNVQYEDPELAAIDGGPTSSGKTTLRSSTYEQQLRYSRNVRPGSMTPSEYIQDFESYHSTRSTQHPNNSYNILQNCSIDENSLRQAFSKQRSGSIPSEDEAQSLHEVKIGKLIIMSDTKSLPSMSGQQETLPSKMEDAVHHCTIPRSGGVIGTADCVVTFQKNTFQSPVEVKLSCCFLKKVSF